MLKFNFANFSLSCYEIEWNRRKTRVWNSMSNSSSEWTNEIDWFWRGRLSERSPFGENRGKAVRKTRSVHFFWIILLVSRLTRALQRLCSSSSNTNIRPFRQRKAPLPVSFLKQRNEHLREESQSFLHLSLAILHTNFDLPWNLELTKKSELL